MCLARCEVARGRRPVRKVMDNLSPFSKDDRLSASRAHVIRALFCGCGNYAGLPHERHQHVCEYRIRVKAAGYCTSLIVFARLFLPEFFEVPIPYPHPARFPPSRRPTPHPPPETYAGPHPSSPLGRVAHARRPPEGGRQGVRARGVCVRLGYTLSGCQGAPNKVSN